MKKSIKIGSQFTGVGAFEYAINRLALRKGFSVESVYAAEWDKFARTSYLANHTHPKFYVKDVNDTPISDIPELDIAMFSPPCQAFSIAGNRKGKEDERGILFFNSHEFIQKNKPRFFIFENVKGLLSDDNGKTFSEWINMLGGKSVNGLPVLFLYDNSVPYHIYYKVLNAKKYGVPQNRERVFIIGIRDDQGNQFNWPKEMHLTKKLKDVLESEVDEKYFLSDKMVSQFIKNDISTDHLIPGDYSNTIRCGGSGSLTEKHNFDMIKVVGNTNPSGNGMNGNVFDENGISPTLLTNKGEGIKIKSATKSGYETATENDSINFSVPNSETRRCCVGKEVAQTLDTQCNQGIMIEHRGHLDKEPKIIKNGVVPCLRAESHGHETKVCVPVLTPDRQNKRQNGRMFKTDGEPSFTLTAQDKHGIFDGYRIRRLTPLECFRLMGFPDKHVEKCKQAGISDSQLYKQAGNSIVVDVLEEIISKFKL